MRRSALVLLGAARVGSVVSHAAIHDLVIDPGASLFEGVPSET
jgi:hypothetical protein